MTIPVLIFATMAFLLAACAGEQRLSIGPLGDGALLLPTADVTALAAEQSTCPGRHKGAVQAPL